ncbi:MAG: hypothetical protein J6W38_08755 [Prevotella sp.]|nr:hypothetical protein [Prevotella sp.]
MEKEISETYYFNPANFDKNGRRMDDGMTFRNLVKNYERDFHDVHSTEYALNLYANSNTMDLLAKSNDAAPFMMYGMQLTQGKSFDAEKDPYNNHQMDIRSKYIYVYGIDSAFMTEFDEHGYPIIDEDGDIYPLTLLVDDNMRDGTIRLSVPTMDDDGDELKPITIDVPQFEYI